MQTFFEWLEHLTSGPATSPADQRVRDLLHDFKNGRPIIAKPIPLTPEEEADKAFADEQARKRKKITLQWSRKK